VDSGKQLLQTLLESLVLAALVVLADEVAAGFEGFACEIEGGAAEVLIMKKTRSVDL
jgi:hypothetical protein